MKIKNLKFKIRDILFFSITTGIILTLNLIPLITHVRHAPAGRTYGLIHSNVQDFYFYLALMNEGANGSTLTYDPFTSEPHQSSIIFSYFLTLGKLSKLLHLSFAFTYHLARFIFGFLFLLSAFYLLLSIRIPHPRLAYLFFLFAAPFMHTINDYGKFISVPYMNWWNGVDPIRRAAFLPHHMAGGLLLVISIILIFKYIHQTDKKYIVLMTLLSALMDFAISITSNFNYLFITEQKIIPNYQTYWFIGLLGYWVIFFDCNDIADKKWLSLEPVYRLGEGFAVSSGSGTYWRLGNIISILFGRYFKCHKIQKI